MRPALLALATLAACHAHPVSIGRRTETTVAAGCRVYLTRGAGPVTAAVLAMGGTGTGSADFVPPDFAPLIARGVAFVSFDKPGVAKRGIVDDAAFARHTQGTLLDCAEQVLPLVPGVRWHLRGHSEGALLALVLLGRHPAGFASAILSGVPLEPMADLVRRQLADRPELARAVAACDWPTMRDATGVSCAYLDDAAARPSGRQLFEQLAAANVRVPIRILAGTADANTPAAPVRDLAASTTGRALDLQVHYHGGAHAGTDEAHRKLRDLLDELVH